MDRINVNNKTYYSWVAFLSISGLKNRKSIYDWVKSGKAEVYKVGSASFYREV